MREPVPLLTRARDLFRTPADRRLAAAEAEAWTQAPRPSTALALAAPFSGAPQSPGRAPMINWSQDQMEPAPRTFTFQPGYSDHTYQQQSMPLGFEGWDLNRIDGVVVAHRLGIFIQSYSLLVACLGFAPVLAALQQAIAPILALRKHVHGGDKGIAKEIAALVTEQLVPRSGLLPSPYLPPELWGTMAIYLRMLGFCVLQHVDGAPDPVTSIRPRYTRIWEPWATSCQPSPMKWLAYTNEGAVEIKNDGHFTLICDEVRPHHSAALCALGPETYGGKLTQAQRAQWLDFFGDPKLYATLPQRVATGSPTGDDFAAAMDVFYGPAGRAVLPYGSTVAAVNITGEGSKAFQDALLDRVIHIFMVLTGSAGTIGSGGATGAGPYQPQKGGPWNVRHDLIARPTLAMVRGINQGHVAPFLDVNFSAAIAGAKRAGTWVDPVLDIPIPAPDRDERIDSLGKREVLRTDIMDKRRASGIVVTQLDADNLADDLEVRRVSLADSAPTTGEIFAWMVTEKVIAPDEVRATRGLDAMPDGAGSVGRLAEERLAGKDRSGTKASLGDAEIDGKPDTAPEDAEPAAGAGSGGSGDASGATPGDKGGHEGS